MPLVVVHGYAIGSEIDSPPMIAFYALLAATALIVVVRALVERSARRPAT